MSRARWENVIGGSIVFVILFAFGLYLEHSGNWPFGLFWNIIYALCGGLGYIMFTYFNLDKDDK